MSRKLIIALVATTAVGVSFPHSTSARGGGSHGGSVGAPQASHMLSAAPGSNSPIGTTRGTAAHSNANSGAPSAGVRANVAPPVSALLGQTAPPMGSGLPPAQTGGLNGSANGASGGPPANASVGNLNNSGGVSGTGDAVVTTAQPPLGTNSAGTAQSSGLPTNVVSERRRTKVDDIRDRDDAAVDRVVRSICRGC
jgi:hypothetical protein